MGVGRGGQFREAPADLIEMANKLPRKELRRHYRTSFRVLYRWLQDSPPTEQAIKRANNRIAPLMPVWECLHEDKYAAAVRAATVRLGAASVALMARGAL